MSPRYVVVDGSNIATEGRSLPSLAQLDEAVRAFMEERPDDEQVIVVVDASFVYRIDESEKAEYQQAEAAGEIVSPPAGAIGRGDGYLLKIADRTDAVVLSNDSFQEFHAEYPWLFNPGRLMGGKPVPGVGWIFTPRAPVRGEMSRKVTRAAKKAQRAPAGPKRAAVAEGTVAMAIAEATAEAIDPDEEQPDAGTTETSGRRGRRRRAKPVGSVNDPLPFIQFIADHPLGTEVEGEVEEFTSHGAFVGVSGARCYVPLVALGDPPPRSAKSVLKRGEVRTFVVQALDAPRRGIELALPGSAHVRGTPTEETVEADIGAGRKSRPPKAAPAEPAAPAPEPEPAPEPVAKRARRSRKKAAEPVAEVEPVPAARAPEPEPAPEPAPELVRDTVPAPVAKPAKRSRKKAAAPVVEVEPVPSPEPEPAPAAKKARRTRKAAAPPVDAPEEAAPPEPAPARRTRKKAVAAAVETPAAEAPAPAPAKRSRKKKTAAVPEAVSEPAEPVKKRASRKKAAPVETAEEPAPAPPKRSRRTTSGR